jgi:hypothetical protein
MHRSAFARPQRRAICGRRAWPRALENRLAWDWASWHWTHRSSGWCSGRARRCHWPQRRLIDRTWSSLGNDHAGRRYRRWWRRGRGCRPGGHGRRYWGRRRDPRRSCDWRSGTYRRPRRSHGRNWGAWRHRCHSLRRCGRCRSCKCGPGSCSWHYELRWSGRRRSRRSRHGNGRGRRRRRDGRLGLDGRRSWHRGFCSRSLLFADNGP